MLRRGVSAAPEGSGRSATTAPRQRDAVSGPLGQTVRLGLATDGWPGGQAGAGRPHVRAPGETPSRPLEANPQAGGTALPNAGSKAGRRGPSDGGSRFPIAQTKRSREPAVGTGLTHQTWPTEVPGGWGTTADGPRGRPMEAPVFKNRVSEIVRMVP